MSSALKIRRTHVEFPLNDSGTFTDRVGHNEVIGVCRAGPDAEGLGRDHWNEMLAYPRKPITHWHTLGEVEICIYKPF